MSEPTPQQRQLDAWKIANPDLAALCQKACGPLQNIFNAYIERLTSEIIDGEEGMIDSEFMVNEFVDRYGNRAAQMTNMVSMLGQLGSPPTTRKVN